jgi:hypothetical protein
MRSKGGLEAGRQDLHAVGASLPIQRARYRCIRHAGQFLVVKRETVPDKKKIKGTLESRDDFFGTNVQIGKETLTRK